MLTFGITTTTKMASLCLFDDIKGVLCEISAEVSKTHSTTIIDQIDKMLEWSGKSLEDIDNVIVSVGPGSFTGVRIAIATVKGMFHGRDVSIFEVNELEALAYQSLSILNTLTDKKIISMIDSNKEKIYYNEYIYSSGNLKSISEAAVIKLDDLLNKILNSEDEYILVGDAVLHYKEKIKNVVPGKVTFIEDVNLKITASTFIEMLKRDILRKVDIHNIKPYYLEKSQAERDKEVGNV